MQATQATQATQIDREAVIDKYAQLCVDLMDIDDLVANEKARIEADMQQESNDSLAEIILSEFPDDFPELAQ